MDNFEEIFEQVDQVEGWMGKPDLYALYTYVKNVEGLIVEIGSYMGRSTKLLALVSPRSKIIAIDSCGNNNYSPHKRGKIKNTFLKTINGLNVTLIQKKSSEVGAGWKTPIDFLHVDGNHLYGEVKKDIELFVPHVKKGCYVFFHDYNRQKGDQYEPEKHGVWKAVEKLKDKYFSEVLTAQEYGFAICRKK